MNSILVVDDDITLCKVLSEELVEAGYNVTYVLNADDALDKISNEKPDIILLDLKMPGKDGFDVLKELSVRNDKTPVIVLTAYADVKSAMEATKMGAIDFISKPYDYDELLLTIRRVLQS